MKKRLLACVLAVFVVLAALPLGMFVSAETTSLTLCACDTTTGWTKVNATQNALSITSVRAQAQSDDGAIAADTGYGFFQAYYVFPAAVDVSDYTAFEWDVCYTGANGINELLTAYAEAGYVRFFSNGQSPTNAQSNSLVFRFDTLEATSINANWARLKATFANASINRNFDPTALTAFRFYTSENSPITTVANGALRLDNIAATGETAVVPDPDPDPDPTVQTEDVVISNCDTLVGWTKVNGMPNNPLSITTVRAQAQSDDGAIAANTGYGFYQAYYTLPAAIDITGCTAIEWDVCYTGANGIEELLTAYAEVGYVRLFSDGQSPTNSQSNSLVFRLDKLEATSINVNWTHLKATIANPTVNRNFNPAALTAFRFYTSENNPITTVANGVVRLDNIKATGKQIVVEPSTEPGDANGDKTADVKDYVVVKSYLLDNTVSIETTLADLNGDGFVRIDDMTHLRYLLLGVTYTAEEPQEPVEATKIISDCETATGWASESGGAGVALAAGRGIDSTGAIYAYGGYGALRRLTYTLPAAMDISAYSTLEWDMQCVVQSGANQGKDNFEAVAEAYADYMAVELSDGTNTGVFALNSWEVGEAGTGNYRHFKVSIAGTSVDLGNITSFVIYALPNGQGATVNTVENSIFRFDNVLASNESVTPNQGGGSTPALTPLMITDCENNTGWSYELGGTVLTGSNLGIDGNYVSISPNKGALRKLTYTPSSPVNISGYTTLQWEMVLKSSSAGSDYFYAAAEAYEDYTGITVTDGSKSVDFGIDKWQIGNISGDWRTMAVSLAGSGLDLSTITSISFYTLPANTGTVNDNLDNIVVRLDNIKATTDSVTPNWDVSGSEEEAAFMPKLFSDGMLFQQNKPMNVWGKTDEGNTVEVKLLNGTSQISSSSDTADSDGNWSVALPARAGGNTSYTLEVRENGTLKKTVNDVLIGELWVSSGQSNMEFFLGNTVAIADLGTITSNQYIRIFKEPSVPTADGADGILSATPVYDIIDDVNNSKSVGHGTWVKGNGSYSDLCYVSAIAYKTAVQLQAQLGVPVGIINTARGSSVIESWLSRDSIDNNATIKNKLVARGAYYTERNLNMAKNWQYMTTLYNTKLAPIAGMAPDNTKLSAHSGMNIAGVMWYQGESNIKYAETNGQNTYYTAALNQLIDDWSEIFGFENGSMPFIFAHVAPCDYSSVRTNDYDSAVAQLSAAMDKAWAAHKNTAIQIPIYDLPLDYTLPAGYDNQAIHPWQKQPVADRFADTILGKFYGGNTGYDAPVYKSSTISGNTVRITMDNIGTGLKVGSGNTKIFGFTVCGADHVFVNADATLEGNTIVVSSPFVANPVAAAYGFNTFNTNANLYNSYDLPAVPFYTAEFADAVYLGDHDDWMSCDYTTVWRDNGITTGNYVDTWKASNTTGSTVTFDTSNKHSGNSAIKVVTTSASRGASPVLKPSAVTAYRQHFADYDYLSVYVKNGGTSDITLRLQIGSACYATTVGGNGSSFTVAAGSGFTKYTFNISSLVNTSNGNASSDTQIANAFAQNTLSFIAAESNSTFYIDDIYLGTE